VDGDSIRVDAGEDRAMTVPTGDALAALQHAVAGLPDADDGAGFDAAEHATRFEAVHEALVAVLADVDRT
jgi:ABC-type iron transport system FetAB ATPase subunit